MYNFNDEIRVIQNWLFDLGAYIATPLDSSTSEQVKRTEFTKDKETYIHTRIRWLEKEIPKQTSFIIPNGNLFSIGLFRISGKVRRTEIDIIDAIIKDEIKTVVRHNRIATCDLAQALPFINRLSDYFYVLARYINHHHKIISSPYIKNMKMKIDKDGNTII